MRYSLGLPELRPYLVSCGLFNAPSYRELYAMILDGRLPAKRIRGRWYIEREDVIGIRKHLMNAGANESIPRKDPETDHPPKSVT